MAHLEGVLTLVSNTGPWFRIQGRHIRPEGSNKLGLRLGLDPHSGATLDVHLGQALWIRLGWAPAHVKCNPLPVTNDAMVRGEHRCWARALSPRVLRHGMA